MFPSHMSDTLSLRWTPPSSSAELEIDARLKNGNVPTRRGCDSRQNLARLQLGKKSEDDSQALRRRSALAGTSFETTVKVSAVTRHNFWRHHRAWRGRGQADGISGQSGQ